MKSRPPVLPGTASRNGSAARRTTLVVCGYSLALSALILGPLLGPGYLLLRDAVSTPRSYLTDAALGLSDAAARAVPQDAVLAVLSTVVDGGLLVKAILLACLWLTGTGTARMVRTLLPTATLGPQLVAVTVALWNPYVAERLLQGHWSLLAGYAALPWTVSAAVAIRRGRRWGWFALAASAAAAGLTPTGAMLATVTALVVLAAPGGVTRTATRLAGALALSLAASAPWLVATAVSSGAAGEGSDPAGVAAFAARAEPGLATIGSLLGLGGIWNSTAVPNTRTSLFAVAGTVLLIAVVVMGLPALWRRRRNPVIGGLAVLAVVAAVGPALGATAWGLSLGEWAVQAIPGSGLLRDAQKWVALAFPLYALAGAAAVMRKQFTPAWSAAAALAILLALPDLAWGVGGALKPVRYPDSWNQVAAELSADADTGDVAVLPAGMFRKFDYSGSAPVLDPAPRMLPEDVLQTGELPVAGGKVAGEGTRAEAVETHLLSGGSTEDLAALGVRWVLVEQRTPGEMGNSEQTLAQLEKTYDDGDLALYRVEGDVPADSTSASARVTVLIAHGLWVVLLVGGIGGAGLAVRVNEKISLGKDRRNQT
ncbi:hypothetical protein [Rhodococcus sp. NPDC058521]|uniref:hypothetical protein n=1 Tax=Rhodococcus sp. NPDC058521 TaxID=3346536 RepID=UPI0036581F39